MKSLGIDYGRRKIGLAIAEGPLAEPLRVIRVKSMEESIREVSSHFAKASRDKRVDIIVVGKSEGEMGKEAVNFGKKLEKSLGVEVVYKDETLSTKDAQNMSIEAGVRRSKRKKMEDAYSAAIILQSYLDSEKYSN